MSVELDEAQEALSLVVNKVPTTVYNQLAGLTRPALLRIIGKNKNGNWEVPSTTELTDWSEQMNFIASELSKRGVSPAEIADFLAYPRTPKVVNKLVCNIMGNPQKELRFPTKEEITFWRTLPHDFNTLRMIKCPTLCGWDVVEIIKVMAPYLGKHIRKFSTVRCDEDECKSNGAVGVLNALHTDAGMSKFAHHVFLHIKTCVRRASATSGIIKEPERRPSKTEVRRQIGFWLCGNWTAQTEIDISEVKAPINQEVLITSDDFVLTKVQKTGVREAKETLVRENLPLSRFQADKVLDLLDYLNWRFEPPTMRPILDSLHRDKYKTIGDLVRTIATCPDFHSNPVSLDVQMEDGAALHDAVTDDKSASPLSLVEKSENKDFTHNLLQESLCEVDLSPEQYCVAWFRWYAPVTLNGADISSRFGELIQSSGAARLATLRERCKCGSCGKCEACLRIADMSKKYAAVDKKKKVSRQRIMQFEETVRKKLLDYIFHKVILSRIDRQSLLESAKRAASLSHTESQLVDLAWGIDGDEEANLPFVLANFGKIVNAQIAINRSVLKEALLSIKQKLLKTII